MEVFTSSTYGVSFRKGTPRKLTPKKLPNPIRDDQPFVPMAKGKGRKAKKQNESIHGAKVNFSCEEAALQVLISLCHGRFG